ncbi:MAG TPA: radical SAM protein [Coriobacteriia bacterium]|nr:radical SAM protein [Coriobacteriia bacterium]
MEKVLLVDCTATLGHVRDFHCGGLLAIGTVLQDAGYEVELLEYPQAELGEHYWQEPDWDVRVAKDLLARGSRTLLFHTLNLNYLDTVRLAKVAKELDPSVRIAFGGPQAAHTAAESMAAFPYVDLICIGEADDTIVPIVRYLQGELPAEEVPGVLYRDAEGAVRTTPLPECPPALDELPWPDYSLVGGLAGEAEYPVPVDTGRGCPFTCRFCSTRGFHRRRVRVRPIDSVVGELRRLRDLYGRTDFEFNHDLFTARRDKVIEFCDALIAEELNVTWKCSARVDTLDDELLDKMAAAGCVRIFLGVETGSQRMQDIINKKLDTSTLVPVVKSLLERNITPRLAFVYGFPEETEDDLKETMSLIVTAIRLGVDDFQIWPLIYLPGTVYTEQEAGNLVFHKDNPLVEMAYRPMTTWEAEVVEANPSIFPFFYDRPTPVTQKYQGLELFWMTFHEPLVRHYPAAYIRMIDAFGGDLLDLFLALQTRMPDFGERSINAWIASEGDAEEYQRLIAPAFVEFIMGLGEAESGEILALMQ